MRAELTPTSSLSTMQCTQHARRDTNGERGKHMFFFRYPGKAPLSNDSLRYDFPSGRWGWDRRAACWTAASINLQRLSLMAISEKELPSASVRPPLVRVGCVAESRARYSPGAGLVANFLDLVLAVAGRASLPAHSDTMSGPVGAPGICTFMRRSQQHHPYSRNFPRGSGPSHGRSLPVECPCLARMGTGVLSPSRRWLRGALGWRATGPHKEWAETPGPEQNTTHHNCGDGTPWPLLRRS